MLDYVKGMLQGLTEDMTGEAVKPASLHLLFNANNNKEKVDKATGNMFHHNTVKLLFLCKRTRPDTQTAVAFLCTRVQKPDVNDYKKLARVMKYLRLSKEMLLVLEADGTNAI